MAARPALARLLSFSPGSLTRVLSSILDAEPASLRADSYLIRALAALRAAEDRPWRLRHAAGSLALILELPDAPDTAVQSGATLLREELCRAAGREYTPPPDPRPTGTTPVAGETPAGETTPDAGAPTDAGATPDAGAPRLPVVVWLPHIRSPFNAGNILRSAAAFGVAGVVLGQACPSSDHPRFRRAAMGAEALVPVRQGGMSEARALLAQAAQAVQAAEPERHGETDTTPVLVLETGGTPLGEYSFPETGILVCGHEELGVERSLVEDAFRTDRLVSIPHQGPKQSLNVGVAVGIALCAWNDALRGRLRG